MKLKTQFFLHLTEEKLIEVITKFQISDFLQQKLTLKKFLTVSENDEDGGLLMTCWSGSSGCSKGNAVMSGGEVCASSAAAPPLNPNCCWLIITFTSLRCWHFRQGAVSEVKGKQGDPGGWRSMWVEWCHSTGAACLEPSWSKLYNGTDEDRRLFWALTMGQALRSSNTSHVLSSSILTCNLWSMLLAHYFMFIFAVGIRSWGLWKELDQGHNLCSLHWIYRQRAIGCAASARGSF